MFSSLGSPETSVSEGGPGPTTDLPAWRARTLRRSLGGTRNRSDGRVAALVAATRSLIVERGGTGFTVQEVVGRARLSLKTCYRHFAGKDDLLLAAFEESTREGARFLAALAARADTPSARLRACVVGLCSTPRGPAATETRVVAREHLRLAEAHPSELRAALEPLVAFLTGVVAEAAAAGEVRAGDARRDAAMILQLCVAHIHADVLGLGDSWSPDDVWEFCRAALAPAPAGRSPKRKGRRS